MKNDSPLIAEINALRERIAELEAQSVIGHMQDGPIRSQEEGVYRALFNSMELGVVYQDANGAISMANPAAERILGLSLDEMQGRKSVDPRWRAIREDGSDFPGEQHPAIQSLRTGKVIKDVVMGVYHPRENEYRWILVNAVPEFLDGENHPSRVFTTFSDITEKKRADDALRESQQRYEFTVDAANVGTWDWHIPTGEVIFNERWAEILGYTLAELAPLSIQTWLMLAHPVDLQHSNRLLEEHFNGEIETYHCKCRMRHKDGTWIWVYDRGKVVSRDAHGRPLRMLGAHTDITELMQTEEQLNQARNFLQEAQDSLSENIAILDEDGVIVHVNSAWNEFGKNNGFLALEHGLGTNYLQVCDATTGSDAMMAQRMAQAIRSVLAGTKQSAQIEYSTHNLQEEHWFIVSITRFSIDTQTWVVLAHENITQLKMTQHELLELNHTLEERVQARTTELAQLNETLQEEIRNRKFVEKVLEEQRDFFQQVINTMGQGLVVTDTYSRIEMVNPAFAELSGYKPEDLIGQLAFDFLKNEDRALAGQARLASASGKTTSYEVRGVRKDGSLLPVLITTAPRLKDGNFNGSITVVTDLGQIKQAEQLRREADERFNKAFRSSPVGLHVFSLADGRSRDANDTFLATTGYTRQELIGHSAAELNLLVDPGERAVWMEKVQQVGRVENTETRIRTKNGELRSILFSIEAFQMQGEWFCMALSMDISERVQAEQALRASEQLYHNMFENNSAVKLLIDPETGAIVRANQAAAEFYGWRVKQLESMNINEINTLAANQIRMEMLLASREERGFFRFRHRLASGKVRDVEVHSSPLDIGQRKLLFSIIHDVTVRKQAEEALRLSEQQYRNLVDLLPSGVVVQAADKIVLANQASATLFGASNPVDLIGDSLNERLHPDYRQPYSVHSEQMLQESGQIPWTELMLRKLDGSHFEAEVAAMPTTYQNNPVLIAVINDISNRKRAEEELRLFQFTMDHVADVVYWTDTEARFIYVNQAACSMLGYSQAEWHNMRVGDIDSSYPAEVWSMHWADMQQNGSMTIETVHRAKDGHEIAVEVITNFMRVGEHAFICAVVRDVSKRKEAEDKILALNAELEHLAVTDFLTNLPNRRFFKERSDEEFKRSRRSNQPLSVFMMDIDHFKKLNDTYGHEIGDLALQQVAAILRSNLREIDLPARIGGEEFVVLLANTDLDEAILSAERIRNAISTFVLHTHEKEITWTASFGVAMLSDEMTGLEDLIRMADDAMYRAKQAGRNRVMD
jgi:diguanylate cyclase (GGDEF)-like protein/PAS domain S-box-containing protein